MGLPRWVAGSMLCSTLLGVATVSPASNNSLPVVLHSSTYPARGLEDPVSLVNSLDGPVVEFVLENTGDQAVTAWCIELAASYPDGSIGRSGARTDHAFWLPEFGVSVRPGIGPLRPAEVRKIQTSVSTLNGEPPVSVEARLSAVVLSDGRTLGDPRQIDAVVHARRDTRRAFEGVLRVLQDASRSTPAEEALKVALENLGTPGGDDSSRSIYQTARREVEFALAQSAKGASGSGLGLDDLIRKYRLSSLVAKYSSASTQPKPR